MLSVLLQGIGILPFVGLGAGIYHEAWRKGTLITCGIPFVLLLLGGLIFLTAPAAGPDAWFSPQQGVGLLICLCSGFIVTIAGMVLCIMFIVHMAIVARRTAI